MLKLERPTQAAGMTFTTCISRVRDSALKARLESVSQLIINASSEFNEAAERHSLHEVVRDVMVGGVVTTEEMDKVYTQRMAKTGAPGRGIYDEIFNSSPNGRCPLCAHRPVATLDHHLPKSHYPALAVAPLNLIPSCSDCNKAKLATVPQTASDVGIHPYYDDVDDDLWLVASVVEVRPAAVRFYVEVPDGWGAILAARIKKHFRTLGLAKLYSAEAAEELLHIRHQLEGIHAASGVATVREELLFRARSCARNRQNGWRAVTYSAWANSDWFCNGGFRSD
jgi:hypothetical protein